MLVLNEANLTDYIREHLFEPLGLAPGTAISNVAVAGGGLVSAVYRARVGKVNLYFKQAIPGKLDKVKELVGDTIPADAFVVWYDDRQLAEVKALQMVKSAVADDFVPTVHHHDADNNIMVLSEVCDGDGVVLAEVMNRQIDVRPAGMLGENIARVANHTYGRFEPLRDEGLEARLKDVKYRYEIRDVWEGVAASDTKCRVIEKVSAWVSDALAQKTVLVHGDLHDRNIIVCEDRCGTYDLEECHWGDPVEDIGKLATSYLLRMIYFDHLRERAFEALTRLLDRYFETLRVPESRQTLEKSLRIVVAGCLLMRVDGISSLWLPWVHDDSKKENTRRLAVKLVLEEKQAAFLDVIRRFF